MPQMQNAHRGLKSKALFERVKEHAKHMQSICKASQNQGPAMVTALLSHIGCSSPVRVLANVMAERSWRIIYCESGGKACQCGPHGQPFWRRPVPWKRHRNFSPNCNKHYLLLSHFFIVLSGSITEDLAVGLCFRTIRKI